jgi:hypothetical protein
MAIYTVHIPPLPGPAAAAETVFVRDGFSLAAALALVPWLLWHGVWVLALAALAGFAVVYGGLALSGFAEVMGLWVTLALAVLGGLEAATLRRFGLSRRGYVEAGIVAAPSIEEAERRWFAKHPVPASRPVGPGGGPAAGGGVPSGGAGAAAGMPAPRSAPATPAAGPVPAPVMPASWASAGGQRPDVIGFGGIR